VKYKYVLPQFLPELMVAAADGHEPGVVQLYRLAYGKAMYLAVRDWPRFRMDDDIMEAAKETCKQLLQQETEEDTAVTNSVESFSLLFLQTFYGAYQGVIETAERSAGEMLELVRLIRHRTEDDAIAVLAEISLLASNGETR
jgi:hypothetical protein